MEAANVRISRQVKNRTDRSNERKVPIIKLAAAYSNILINQPYIKLTPVQNVENNPVRQDSLMPEITQSSKNNDPGLTNVSQSKYSNTFSKEKKIRQSGNRNKTVDVTTDKKHELETKESLRSWISDDIIHVPKRNNSKINRISSDSESEFVEFQKTQQKKKPWKRIQNSSRNFEKITTSSLFDECSSNDELVDGFQKRMPKIKRKSLTISSDCSQNSDLSTPSKSVERKLEAMGLKNNSHKLKMVFKQAGNKLRNEFVKNNGKKNSSSEKVTKKPRSKKRSIPDDIKQNGHKIVLSELKQSNSSDLFSADKEEQKPKNLKKKVSKNKSSMLNGILTEKIKVKQLPAKIFAPKKHSTPLSCDKSKGNQVIENGNMIKSTLQECNKIQYKTQNNSLIGKTSQSDTINNNVASKKRQKPKIIKESILPCNTISIVKDKLPTPVNINSNNSMNNTNSNFKSNLDSIIDSVAHPFDLDDSLSNVLPDVHMSTVSNTVSQTNSNDIQNELRDWFTANLDSFNNNDLGLPDKLDFSIGQIDNIGETHNNNFILQGTPLVPQYEFSSNTLENCILLDEKDFSKNEDIQHLFDELNSLTVPPYHEGEKLTLHSAGIIEDDSAVTNVIQQCGETKSIQFTLEPQSIENTSKNYVGKFNNIADNMTRIWSESSSTVINRGLINSLNIPEVNNCVQEGVSSANKVFTESFDTACNAVDKMPDTPTPNKVIKNKRKLISPINVKSSEKKMKISRVKTSRQPVASTGKRKVVEEASSLTNVICESYSQNLPKPANVLCESFGQILQKPANDFCENFAQDLSKSVNVISESFSQNLPKSTNIISESFSQDFPKPANVISESFSENLSKSVNVISETFNQNLPKLVNCISEALSQNLEKPANVISETFSQNLLKPVSIISETFSQKLPKLANNRSKYSLSETNNVLVSDCEPLQPTEAKEIQDAVPKKSIWERLGTRKCPVVSNEENSIQSPENENGKQEEKVLTIGNKTLDSYDRKTCETDETSSTMSMSKMKTPPRSCVNKEPFSKPEGEIDEDDDDDCISLFTSLSLSEDEAPYSPRHRRFTSEREIPKEPELQKKKMPPRNVRAHPTNQRIKLLRNNQQTMIQPNEKNKPDPHVPNTQIETGILASDRQFDEFVRKNEAQFEQDFEFYRNSDMDETVKFDPAPPSLMSTPVNYMPPLIPQRPTSPKNMPLLATEQFSSLQARVSPFVRMERPHQVFFKKCHQILRRGNCSKSSCIFIHSMKPMMMDLKNKSSRDLMFVIEHAINHRFNYLIQIITEELFHIFTFSEGLEAFSKIYNSNSSNKPIICNVINTFFKKEITAKNIVDSFCNIINKKDSSTVRAIFAAVKEQIEFGYCWETIGGLCTEIAPPVDAVETILRQCIGRKKSVTHLKEVHNFFINVVTTSEKNIVDSRLKQQFLTMCQNQSIINVENTFNTTPTVQNRNAEHEECIASPEPEPAPTPIPTTNQNEVPKSPPVEAEQTPKLVKTTIVNRPNEEQVSVGTDSLQLPPNNGARDPRSKLKEEGSTKAVTEASPADNSASSYCVQVIDGLKEPTSAKEGKERFWKFYGQLDLVKKGLSYEDYDFVWELISKLTVTEEENALLRRSLYQIVAREINRSAKHISEIVKRAGNRHTFCQFLRGQNAGTQLFFD